MNRRIFVFFASFICYFSAHKTHAQLGTADSSSLVIDSLYAIVWEHYPQNAIVEYQASQSFYGMRAAQFAFTKDIGAQFNINEFQLNPSAGGGNNLFFPRYNFGVRIDLGTFFVRPYEAKKARQEYNAAMWKVELQKSDIRSLIIQKVQLYKLAKNILRIKTQALEESNTLQIVIRQRFQRNEITIEEYNNSNIANLTFLQERYAAETQLHLAKNDLETLTGRKLETLKFLPKDF